ncbi:MAG TPA: HPF/RaiA family ribosome-associated protein [Candidatus Dojkabacteria bacterium]|nr:HPF/RaiA family ribosome-associated protein [Candidatus Dojkabacteria bacterium]HRO64955.1 HPF/RaiA family ribosome-associated protein [Candidatus Dojkabacteria bacterium]HRP36834.1 HPF/RaiA family ribosome-associated protein [Candidatus Dojkabacteria bacterium]HRP51237.1 HPF/RaiA family ribosome-associated protein [Candidatus Dojkabacteria bacterium]
MVDPTYVQKGFKLSEKSKEYINTKLKKHAELLSKSTSITVHVRSNKNYPPNKQYRMEINVTMPHIFIKVEERGVSVEALIDSLEVLLKRKLTRYQEQFKKWEKQEPWKIKEAKESAEEFVEQDYSYSDYKPVVKNLKFETNRPMHVGEAIERLEMSGKNAFLFRNIASEKYSMLYRNSDDEYELTEADV